MHVTLIQHYGDYRSLIEAGSGASAANETYRGQAYVLDTLRELASEFGSSSLVVCAGGEKFDVNAPGGVRLICAGINPYESVDELDSILEEVGATHLVVGLPCRRIFRLARRRGLPCLPMLADSFFDRRLGGRLMAHRLMKELRRSSNYWIADHGYSAAEAITDFGFARERIIPWDWPAITTVPTVHSHDEADREVRLVFVGALLQDKGVGDAVKCLGHLSKAGISAQLDVIGGGDSTWLMKLTRDLGLEQSVRFLGRLPNREVTERMAQASAVLVPSWHEYGEAMPLVMLEALAVGTPIIVSDHPMFTRLLVDRVSAMIVPAKDSYALAEAITELMRRPDLVRTLSRNSRDTLERFRVPGEWGSIIRSWLCDQSSSNRLLGAVSLVGFSPPSK